MKDVREAAIEILASPSTWNAWSAEPGRLIPLAYRLARIYLAEHPADDAEPVTEEWLRSIGFEDWSGADDVRLFGPKHYFMFNRSKETQTVTWWFGSGVGPFPTPATRRAVRDLCRALGIPLKEPA